MTAAEWTTAEIELLTRLWKEGLTAGSIAKKFPTRSRNAVIGKAHRLCLPGRVSPIKVADKPIHTEQSWAVDCCKWIEADPLINPTFCGRQTHGGSWCDEHRAIVFKPSKEQAA